MDKAIEFIFKVMLGKITYCRQLKVSKELSEYMSKRDLAFRKVKILEGRINSLGYTDPFFQAKLRRYNQELESYEERIGYLTGLQKNLRGGKNDTI